ncbi:hypothetical protein HOO68_04350 [Candidatus Gracilibacteria bacterium]|nr:hypothetical protein [Candidatus Gracilibacteria bacterium]
MKKFGTYIILSFFSIIGFTSVYADYYVIPPTQNLPDINSGDPGDAIGAVIAWLIGLTAVLTIVAVTWAGIQMILAVGEEEKMKKARHTMIYSFIGLIIAGLAYAAVQFLTNVRLDNFL